MKSQMNTLDTRLKRLTDHRNAAMDQAVKWSQCMAAEAREGRINSMNHSLKAYTYCVRESVEAEVHGDMLNRMIVDVIHGDTGTPGIEDTDDRNTDTDLQGAAA